MSTRRTRTARRLAALAALAPALALTAGPAAAAPRDPAACATRLASAAAFPGSAGDTRLFSDAYERHLLTDPACARPIPDRGAAGSTTNAVGGMKADPTLPSLPTGAAIPTTPRIPVLGHNVPS